MTTSPEPVEAALALAESRDNIQSRYEAISRMRSNECIGESETADQACVRILAAAYREAWRIIDLYDKSDEFTSEPALRRAYRDVLRERNDLRDEVRRLRAELASQPMIATETHVLPKRK